MKQLLLILLLSSAAFAQTAVTGTGNPSETGGGIWSLGMANPVSSTTIALTGGNFSGNRIFMTLIYIDHPQKIGRATLNVSVASSTQAQVCDVGWADSNLKIMWKANGITLTQSATGPFGATQSAVTIGPGFYYSLWTCGAVDAAQTLNSYPISTPITSMYNAGTVFDGWSSSTATSGVLPALGTTLGALTGGAIGQPLVYFAAN